ncbi:hypothetical protein THASP1DRAFT_22700 [Thamnocephalis sphaerospora]|uniref:Uncharacterized protein n=1 Tax=Thamnocephalis sphaerospora TaxID=78915 RepID=A0A4P9XTG4_9FUNG|nr:hypothetical protein THASP1DRAFT_22700 [Thamnocephalis sphaerospora]|eukprot:RKP09465.1 hypothetical protein THASP1DRAFT_22700 [Thamnocephalis sphaerospora]
MVFARSNTSRLTLALVVLEAIVVIVCESIIFYNLATFMPDYNKDLGKGLPVYFGIFIASQVFQVILVIDAIRMQNTIQIIGFLGFNLCCFLYSILQVNQLKTVFENAQPQEDTSWRTVVNALLIIVAVTIALCEAVYIWLAKQLYQEFGWKIYKKIGADLIKRRMYRDYHICLMLLKLDLFFFMGFCLQFLVLVLSGTDEGREFALTIAALPVTLLAIVVAAYALRREGRRTMWGVFLGLFLAACYFLYKIVRIWTNETKKYENVKYYLTVFVAATFTMSFRCYRNFGQGLRPYLMNQTLHTEMLTRPSQRIVLEDDDDDDLESGPLPGRPHNVVSMQL